MTWLALLAAIAATEMPSMSWEGTAVVFPDSTQRRIVVRTTIDRNGDVVSDSWPIELGERKGLRRMTLTADGGTMERSGETMPMGIEMWGEERAQFGLYRQLQIAAAQAPGHAKLGVTSFSVPGDVATWFRIGPDGSLTEAVNVIQIGKSAPIYQQFRFDGFWQSNGAVFPRRMEIVRDGQRYFTLDVTRFDAR